MILVPINKEDSIVLRCPKCGVEKKEASKTQVKVGRPKEKVVVIEKKMQEIKTLPTTRTVCPKCTHNEAFYWFVQTRGGDESSTQFFRCIKCNFTWREYT